MLYRWVSLFSAARRDVSCRKQVVQLVYVTKFRKPSLRWLSESIKNQ
jgi:hypothetical protein